MATLLVGARSFLVGSIGKFADQQLKGVCQAQVIAVFERSFYVNTATGLCCVGVQGIGRGPLNVVLGSEQEHLPFEVATGEHLLISNRKIFFDNGGVLDATQSRVYQPEVDRVRLVPENLHRNRNALKELQGMPDSGFYWLLSNHPSNRQESVLQSALRRSTTAPMCGLLEWLRAGFMHKNKGRAHEVSAALGFLGAGPGLTPAGDDVLAGIMLALIRFRRADLAESLWQTIAPSLTVLTNTISAAHLEQASQGCCGESMSGLLDEVFHAEKIEAVTIAHVLDSMGCTSGWDTLGGVAMVIDTWLDTINTTHRTVTTC